MKNEVTQFVLLLLLTIVSCTQKMATLGHLRPYAPSEFFSDGTTARALPADTVARGHLSPSNGALLQKIPMPLTYPLLTRGQQRFNIYCSPCHNETGDGQGMIVQRGFLAPPSFYTERLRHAHAGHFFDVITHGYGAMYSYADRVTPEDRWAITAYIRALQLSRHPGTLLQPGGP